MKELFAASRGSLGSRMMMKNLRQRVLRLAVQLVTLS